VAIVDDERMVLQGLQSWLSTADKHVEVVVAARSWAELLDSPQLPVDVVLLDLDLKDHVAPAVKITTLRSAGMATVMISTHANPAEIRGCLSAGALAYLPKSEPAEEVVRAVMLAAAGQSHMTSELAALLLVDREESRTGDRAVPSLSPQELRALVWYASGLPMKSVARRMNIGQDTAKAYVDRVRAKYADAGRDARTKVELYQRAVEDGFLPGPAGT
jgi:DNA-binding NarL/FixJ family response regulator